MLISHLLGASVVEGLVTALGVAYLQKNYPQYLTSLRKIVAGSDVIEGVAIKQPVWQIALIGTGISLVVLIIAGLITGGGDFGKLFGADWSQVNWGDVGVMLLVVGIIAIILVPLAWFALPRHLKKVGTLFTGLAVLVPLGLIAPGFAYGEGSAEDVDKAFGYVPQGLKDFSAFFQAPLKEYNLPFAPFNGENAKLWQQAIGYELTGIIGVLVVGALVYGGAMLLRQRNTGDSGDGELEPARIKSEKVPTPSERI
jgi:hypothetical protein